MRAVRQISMMVAATIIGGISLTASRASADAQAKPALRGFPASQASRELDYERAVNAIPNAATALRDELALSGHVHRMGQPADYRTAVYMRDRLAADGWDAKIVTYVVPIAWPTDQHLVVTSPFAREVDLYEPAIPGDPWSQRHAEIGKPYSGYSLDGDVRGPLIYAGRGMPDDFARLAHMHVSLKSAVVLVKQGGSSSVSKAQRAFKLGAVALLNYPEPGYDPYFPQFHSTKTYPRGPARPLGGALRGTMTIEDAAGDPTAIGIPVPGAKHKPFSVMKLPPIPVMNVTALVAQQLAAHLGGPAAPAQWRTKILAGIHVGGVERVHFVLKSRRFFGPIWNVIATMKGAVAPDETIVIGGHRDAWTYGALDPGSGSVALLQTADALSKLRATGWRPYRTIVIGSWDGEELNDFGSAIWVDQNRSSLLRNCWAYINTDEVATGPTYLAYSTDDLIGLMRSVADIAAAPNGGPLTEYWHKQDRKRAVFPAGTGSDHESFEYHLNIPSAGGIYAGVFGTWHSAYDDVASLRVFDPGMRLADAAARLYSVLVLRLADAPYPDVRYQADALALQRRLNAFANGANKEVRRTEVVRTLQPYADRFAALAASLDSAVDQASANDDAKQLRSLKSLAFAIRAAFYSPSGIPDDSWQGSVLYNSDDNISTLPSLETTLDPKAGKAALDQLVAALGKLPPLLLVSR